MMKKFEKWKTLNQWLEHGVFAFVDLVFAESVLKKINSDREEYAALLATLFALSRQGHLTLDLSKEALHLTLRLLSAVEIGPLAELLQLGAATFPSQVIADVKNDDDRPNAWVCRFGTRYYLQKNWINESEILRRNEKRSRTQCRIRCHCSQEVLAPGRPSPQLNSSGPVFFLCQMKNGCRCGSF
jgi:hypothetical protein